MVTRCTSVECLFPVILRPNTLSCVQTYHDIELHLEQSSEHVILYRAYVEFSGIHFFPRAIPKYGVLPYSMIQ